MRFLERIAKRRLNLPDAWEIASFEKMDGGFIVQGGVPVMRGKKKRWPELTPKLIVTDAERAAEPALYEAETGKCAACEGTTQEWAGWSKATGTQRRPCRRCHATGVPPPPAEAGEEKK